MTGGRFTESVVEDAALAWLESLGYTIKHGPAIAAGELRMLREELIAFQA
jgi:type I restriction enzyme R subunit